MPAMLTWARWARRVAAIGMVLSVGKQGVAYLLKADQLGGIGVRLRECPCARGIWRDGVGPNCGVRSVYRWSGCLSVSATSIRVA